MDEAARKRLWEEYSKNPLPQLRERLIIEYAQLVKIVAGKLSIYLGGNVEYEDLVGYGIFGLIDAIDKFNVNRDVKFETYASLRIRGAILDQIRKMDWIPRTVRQKQKKIDEAIRTIEQKTGKSATDEEVAAELGIDEDEYYKWEAQLNVTNVISLNEFIEQGNEPREMGASAKRFKSPEQVVEQQELSQKLEEAMQILTDKERKVILLYYYEDMTLKEISKVFEVSESRVSQLHTKALQKIKRNMGGYMEFFTL